MTDNPEEELCWLERRTKGLYEIAHYPSDMWLPSKEWGEDVHHAVIRLEAETKNRLANMLDLSAQMISQQPMDAQGLMVASIYRKIAEIIRRAE